MMRVTTRHFVLQSAKEILRLKAKPIGPGCLMIIGTQGLAIAEKKLGPDHPNVATSLLNIAALLVADRQNDQVLACARQVRRALRPD
jgi:hypothetical protein